MNGTDNSDRLLNEDCRILSVSELRRIGILSPVAVEKTADLSWPKADGSYSSPIRCSVVRDEDEILWVRLSEEFGDDSDIHFSVTLQEIQIDFKQNPISGTHFFFVCPGAKCKRSVRKLYKSPFESKFLCRHCLGLTYRSRSRNYHRSRRDPWTGSKPR